MEIPTPFTIPCHVCLIPLLIALNSQAENAGFESDFIPQQKDREYSFVQAGGPLSVANTNLRQTRFMTPMEHHSR